MQQKMLLFPKICGALVCLLAVGVLVGWYTHNEALIQVLPQFVPMQYNTALGFLFAGAGLLALLWNVAPLVFICGGFVALLGALTLVQYIFHLNFGIDELLMDAYIMVKTSHPGRMAPNTALCFLLYGAALLFHYYSRRIMIGLAASVFVLSVLSLIGYLAATEGIYGWGNLTRMAIHTATSFFLLSVALSYSGVFQRDIKESGLWEIALIVLPTIVAILTFFSWYAIQELGNARNKEYFGALVSDIQDTLQDRYVLYEQGLQGGVGLYYASDQVQKAEWKTYVDALDVEDKFPGINGIGYIGYVEESDLDKYIKKVREDGSPQFINHPQTSHPDKFVITFIEPVDRNVEAVGLDIGFEANRREAAEYARDYGVPALTKKIELVQDAKKEPGFLLLIPVYDTKFTPQTIEERRAHFQGWVYAPFIGSNFLKGLSDRHSNEVNFQVYDGKTIAPEALIFDAGLDKTVPTKSLNYSTQTTIELAKRVWTIQWQSTEAFNAPSNKNTPLVVLVFGLFFTVFLYFMLRWLLRSKSVIEREVEKRTAQLAESRGRLSAILETAPDGILAIDEHGIIQSVNGAIVHIFGYDEEDLLGENVNILIPKEMHTEHDANIRHYIDKGEARVMASGREILGVSKDGGVIPVEVGISKTKMPGGSVQAIATVRDITERKKAEDEIIRSNIELERFAYLASHDLQEPLRMVRNFTALLEDEYAKTMDKKAKEYMEFITDASMRMQLLVSDLLEYSRMGHEEDGFKEFDCNTEIEVVLTNLKETIKSSKATVTHDTLPHLYANAMLFNRLIQNLLSNALKYRAEGRNPEIHIGMEEHDSRWIFYVKDNGIGIKEEYLEKIFEIFKRLHAKHEYGGTGIGLAICKKVVESLGGQLWAESEYGKGSTFYFSIPKMEGRAAA